MRNGRIVKGCRKQINFIAHRRRLFGIGELKSKAAEYIHVKESFWQVESPSLFEDDRGPWRSKGTTVTSTCFISTLYHLNFSSRSWEARAALYDSRGRSGRFKDFPEPARSVLHADSGFSKSPFVERFRDFSHPFWPFEVVSVSQMSRRIKQDGSYWIGRLHQVSFAFNPFSLSICKNTSEHLVGVKIYKDWNRIYLFIYFFCFNDKEIILAQLLH